MHALQSGNQFSKKRQSVKQGAIARPRRILNVAGTHLRMSRAEIFSHDNSFEEQTGEKNPARGLAPQHPTAIHRIGIFFCVFAFSKNPAKTSGFASTALAGRVPAQRDMAG